MVHSVPFETRHFPDCFYNISNTYYGNFYRSENLLQIKFVVIKVCWYSKTSKMTDFGTSQKTFIFKLLLDSYRQTVILRCPRWPLNVICEELELNTNCHLARPVTCEAVICEVLRIIFWNFQEKKSVFVQ